MSKDLKAIIKEKLASGVSMDDLLTEISDTINDTNDELKEAEKLKAEKDKDFKAIAEILNKYLDDPIDPKNLIAAVEWVNDVEKGFSSLPSFIDRAKSSPSVFKFKI